MKVQRCSTSRSTFTNSTSAQSISGKQRVVSGRHMSLVRTSQKKRNLPQVDRTSSISTSRVRQAVIGHFSRLGKSKPGQNQDKRSFDSVRTKWLNITVDSCQLFSPTAPVSRPILFIHKINPDLVPPIEC